MELEQLEQLGPWLGAFFYLAGGMYIVVQIVERFRRKPSVDVDFASITSRLATAEAELARKQDSTLCERVHRDWERELGAIGLRHGSHEEKISRQIGDIHKRIDNQTGAISATGARLETFMQEIRNWRSTHDAEH